MTRATAAVDYTDAAAESTGTVARQLAALAVVYEVVCICNGAPWPEPNNPIPQCVYDGGGIHTAVSRGRGQV